MNDNDGYRDAPGTEAKSAPPRRIATDLFGREIPTTPQDQDTEPSRCYMIGTSMVHVQPGCRCKRRPR